MNNEKLIVALDVPTFAEAEKLVKTLSPEVKIFKVGKELYTAAGPAIIEMIHSHGAKVFLDLKFHDIPNTVASACAAAAKLGVLMMNVHTLGGKKMMQEAVAAVKRATGPGPKNLTGPGPLLIGVTVLTSHSQEELTQIGITSSIPDEVKRLALLSRDAGLDGVVASPKEISLIKEACGQDFKVVTPGVRPDWASADDQKRLMTPKEAVTLGSDYIVVGRPITKNDDPKGAARRVLAEII